MSSMSCYLNEKNPLTYNLLLINYYIQVVGTTTLEHEVSCNRSLKKYITKWNEPFVKNIGHDCKVTLFK